MIVLRQFIKKREPIYIDNKNLKSFDTNSKIAVL